MTETKNEKFMGTYFDRDSVVRVSRWAFLFCNMSAAFG